MPSPTSGTARLRQVDEGTFVILYAPEGPVFENCKEMLAKLDEIGAEVVLVSDNEDIVAGPSLFLPRAEARL